MHSAWLIPALPLLGFLFNLLLGKRLGKSAVTAVAVGTIALSFVLACVAFAAMLHAPGHRLEIGYGEWMRAGAFSVPPVSALYDARPFAFKPPRGFFPAARCHAGVFTENRRRRSLDRRG